LVLLSLIAFTQAGLVGKTNLFRQEAILESAEAEPIAPYSFGYVADATDGRSSRQETSDGSGVVRGSYELSSADGIKRIVNYIADKDGFRAQVQTNEPGTESKSPAFVQFDSSQPPAEEIALKYGPKPVERLPEVGVFHQTISKPVGFGPVGFGPVGFGAVGGTAYLKQKSLIATPVLKQFETNIPSIQTNVNPIETPIKLLTNLPAHASSFLSTNFQPIRLQPNVQFETQQREVQTRESF